MFKKGPLAQKFDREFYGTTYYDPKEREQTKKGPLAQKFDEQTKYENDVVWHNWNKYEAIIDEKDKTIEELAEIITKQRELIKTLKVQNKQLQIYITKIKKKKQTSYPNLKSECVVCLSENPQCTDISGELFCNTDCQQKFYNI